VVTVRLRRAFSAVAVITLLAGCSGNSGISAPSQSGMLPQSHAFGVATRVLPGPVVAGPIVVPLVPRPHDAPAGWPASAKEILFVADGSANQILMYNPKQANPTAMGSITNGLNVPFQVAVDAKGNLYVANIGNNTVTVYPPGKTSPSFTITSGLSSPYGITVDSKGDVFVSNLGSNAVTAYRHGKNTPYETISFNPYGQAVGLAVDGKNNVYVACDSTNAVYEIPAGKTTPVNAGLSGLNGPVGVSVGLKNTLYVGNFGGSNVSVYKAGSKTPSAVITSGIEHNGPTLNGVTSIGSFFQTNQNLNVVGFKAGATSPFSTIGGVSQATGVASSPLVMK